MSRVSLIAALTLLLWGPACEARSHRRRISGLGPFDYYILSLSWSPEHCQETSDNSPQCAGTRRFGFILHGLWPEAEHGRSPQNCAGPPFDPAEAPPGLSNVMPSRQLIEHEWMAHGTCSGLSEKEYFQMAENAFRAVKIPAEFSQPLQQVETTPMAVRHEFAAANAGYGESAFAVKDDGRFLQEVRVCLTASLKPRACEHPGDTRGEPIIVRPQR